MTAVRVFVDDAVLGHLPPVCVRTGKPADMVLASTRPVGGMGAWWLLLLLGPAGFVALVVIALVGQERLTVQLPYTSAAWDEDRLLRARAGALSALGLGSFVVAVAARSLFPLVWVVAGVALVVAGAAMWVSVSARPVRIWLDASRRWVTLGGVHPDFARAVLEPEATIRGAGR